MRQSVQQETIRRLLAEMQDIACMSTSKFTLYHNHLSDLTDVLATLVRTPSLPDFNGPKVEWIGERMIVT